MCPYRATPLFPADRGANQIRQLERIAWRVRTWSARTTPGDEERWLVVAMEETETADLAPASPGAKMASWLALLAYENAARVAAHAGRTYDGTAFSYAEVTSNIDRLSSSMRAPARRAVDSFMRAPR